MSQRPSPYIGRFAPSPTGPLHFGSLVSAIVSFLEAKKASGQWLLRMEDLDPPRQPAGVDAIILRQLEQHGLYWDGEVLFQSSRLGAYQQALEQLQKHQQVFTCTCTRDQIKAQGGIHLGPCISSKESLNKPYAWRISVSPETQISFIDTFKGPQHIMLAKELGDCVVKRKDGLFAYQLASVVDEAYQNISHIIRGGDLLESTFWQIHIQQQLGLATPVYGHIPIAVDSHGVKLSKQTGASSLDSQAPENNLSDALSWLGFNVPKDLFGASCKDLLKWAELHWKSDQLQQFKPEKPACYPPE